MVSSDVEALIDASYQCDEKILDILAKLQQNQGKWEYYTLVGNLIKKKK